MRRDALDELLKWRGDDLIKAVTGVRGCGKTELFKMYIERLKSEGVRDEQIVYVDLENPKNANLQNYRALNSYVMERLCEGDTTYIFLDEVQLVPMFEKTAASLYIQKNTDMYIAGSDAHMLDGEDATRLGGRYIEIRMFPLSFKEYFEARGGNRDEAFSAYLSRGGLPFEVEMNAGRDDGGQLTEGLYFTSIVKYDEGRQRIGEGKKTPDLALMWHVSQYLASCAGTFVSINNVSEHFAAKGERMSNHTADDYVRALCDAYIFYPVSRYDMRTGETLKTNKKYYAADPGLLSCLSHRCDENLKGALENVVFLELRRRGYEVYAGKLGRREVDFAARKWQEMQYIQVCTSLLDEAVFKEAISTLRAIRNNHPKTILTLDKFTEGNYGGIIVENIVDWLLKNG